VGGKLPRKVCVMQAQGKRWGSVRASGEIEMRSPCWSNFQYAADVWYEVTRKGAGHRPQGRFFKGDGVELPPQIQNSIFQLRARDGPG